MDCFRVLKDDLPEIIAPDAILPLLERMDFHLDYSGYFVRHSSEIFSEPMKREDFVCFLNAFEWIGIVDPPVVSVHPECMEALSYLVSDPEAAALKLTGFDHHYRTSLQNLIGHIYEENRDPERTDMQKVERLRLLYALLAADGLESDLKQYVTRFKFDLKDTWPKGSQAVDEYDQSLEKHVEAVRHLYKIDEEMDPETVYSILLEAFGYSPASPDEKQSRLAETYLRGLGRRKEAVASLLRSKIKSKLDLEKGERVVENEQQKNGHRLSWI